MANTYVEYLPLREAAWLKRGFGGNFLQAIGALTDVLADLAREAVKIKFVDRQAAQGASDAQNATGAERSIERYTGESDGAYASRLIAAFDLMADNGRPAGMSTEMTGLGWPSTIVEANALNPNDPRWARFWIYVSNTPPHGVTKAPPVGSGWKVGDGTLVGIGGVSPDKLRRLRRSIIVWKPAHMHNEAVIFVIGGEIVGLGGWKVGDAGKKVGGESVRLQNKGF